jgi:Flp pilus assembly protein TadD
MRAHPTTPTRLLTLAGTLVLTGAALVGCGSGARQADAFGSGGERPPTPRTLHMMAKLINENGRTDQAEFVLSRVIRDTPEYLPAYVELADLYIGHARFDDARDVLRSAHAVAPTDAVIANNLGVLLLREGSFAEASGAFAVAASRDPEEARYHANLAVSHAMQGSYDDAFSAWAAVLPPEEVFWNLAVVAEARGDAESAGEYYAAANDIRQGIDPEAGDTAVARGTENEPGIREQTATVAVPVE